MKQGLVTHPKRSYSARITDCDETDSSESPSWRPPKKTSSTKKQSSEISQSRTPSITDRDSEVPDEDSTSGRDLSSEAESSYIDSDSSGSWCTNLDTEDDEHHFQEFSDNDFSTTASRMDARLRITFDNRKRRVNTHPRLLFRAFEPAHGLKARQFLGNSALRTPQPPPPDFESSDFRSLARRHLRQETFASPFLSWSQNPARILRLIENSGKPRFLAIIDYNDYAEELENRFGRVGIWLVPEICRRHQFYDLGKVGENAKRRPGYTGIGEVSELTSWKPTASVANRY